MLIFCWICLHVCFFCSYSCSVHWIFESMLWIITFLSFVSLSSLPPTHPPPPLPLNSPSCSFPSFSFSLLLYFFHSLSLHSSLLLSLSLLLCCGCLCGCCVATSWSLWLLPQSSHLRPRPRPRPPQTLLRYGGPQGPPLESWRECVLVWRVGAYAWIPLLTALLSAASGLCALYCPFDDV